MKSLRTSLGSFLVKKNTLKVSFTFPIGFHFVAGVGLEFVVVTLLPKPVPLPGSRHC